MSSLFTISIFQSALELGCIYALVALALFISFTILNIADLTTDGCFTLGCAVGAMVTLAGHPFLALFAALISGALAGFVTAFLQTRLGVESILAGIIVNTGLYTINIAVMGFSSIANLFGCDTIFSLGKDGFVNTIFGQWYKVAIVVVIVVIIAVILWWFLGTTLGMSIRATGDNADMVRSSSINPTFTITVGLCLANSLTGLSGALIAQYQKSADINIGTGMVTISLASLIIGQSLIGNKGSMLRRILGTILGSILYRFIVAIALRLSVPAEALKLVSAIIVAVAIATPYVRRKLALKRRELANYRGNVKGEKNA
ncbi:MAG: ABC transporter permease [Pseudobutyrivibrio sp.]|nr:ABC transporter permease [Pseudobutyrivibrio sp.]